MAFTQLNPALPVHVEGKGAGYAFTVIEDGQDHNLFCITALNDSGEIGCAPNPKVRVLPNWTMGRKRTEQDAAPRPQVKVPLPLPEKETAWRPQRPRPPCGSRRPCRWRRG